MLIRKGKNAKVKSVQHSAHDLDASVRILFIESFFNLFGMIVPVEFWSEDYNLIDIIYYINIKHFDESTCGSNLSVYNIILIWTLV